jgi:hypothetical protein
VARFGSDKGLAFVVGHIADPVEFVSMCQCPWPQNAKVAESVVVMSALVISDNIHRTARGPTPPPIDMPHHHINPQVKALLHDFAGSLRLSQLK